MLIWTRIAKFARSRWARRALLVSLLILILGLLWPSTPIIPVAGATSADWNRETFWYDPWGRSGVHKGIDIFAAEGTEVLAATGGVVIYEGDLSIGGNVAIVLGPKWQLHYYAHMQSVDVRFGQRLRQHDLIGRVGATGNAAGKPPHLHYSIATPLPRPWRMTLERQGWKRAFYVNPDRLLR